jgi:hypothetical protein
MPNRNLAIAQAHATGVYGLKDIGDALGLHYATISRVVERVHDEASLLD